MQNRVAAGVTTPHDVARAAERLLAHGRFAEGLNLLYEELDSCRLALPLERWDELCSGIRRDDGLMDVLLQSPFTRRAYEKPRGYAGDAVLIDYIYGYVDCRDDRTIPEAGRRIFSWEFESPGCCSVRARREVLAHALDAAGRRGGANVLAIACGHLREAELSSAVVAGAFETYLAVDQDAQSLAEVDRCYGAMGVTTRCANVRSLIARRHAWPDFDLVYAPGVYDYLPDRAAEALTSALFDMLRPGGRLLIGNCTPDRRDIGYMQAIMDWRLLYRDERQLVALAHRLDPSRIAEITTFRERHRNIAFLDIVKH